MILGSRLRGRWHRLPENLHRPNPPYHYPRRPPTRNLVPESSSATPPFEQLWSCAIDGLPRGPLFTRSCARRALGGESNGMKEGSVDVADRLAVRARPPGVPIMHQHWGTLLFMHWPVPAESLRPQVPEPLAIDTYDGRAWVGITPFTMWGVRPAATPPLPYLSKSHELNVRTYVHLAGVPGVWFFSLDANNAAAVLGARLAFHLPYFNARMRLERRDRTIYFASRRTRPHAASAEFEATWTVGDGLGEARPGSLDFFLIERYCLYSCSREGRLFRARIFHRPWPLRNARLLSYSSTMIESSGLASPTGEPLLHQQAEPLKVRVWPRTRVR